MNRLSSFLRELLLFCTPFFLIIVAYIVFDPFMILFKYEDYNKDFHIQKNLDFVTTEKYLTNLKRYNYDSFIFGGSTALYFSPSIWKPHLDTTNEIYSFNVSTEHIIGIWSKINYLNLNNSQIKNALLIFDVNVTFGKFENDIPIFMKHYEIYPNSRFNFHYKFLLNFLDIRFLVPFLHYKLTNDYHDYMDGILIKEFYCFDPVSNEYHNIGILNELKSDSLNYYESRKESFPPRTDNPLQSEAQINPDHIKMLNEIKSVFHKHNTDYRIIVCPAFNQVSFNKTDLQTINVIFGEKNVFDFSGINEFTEKKSNYYDELHLKKYIGMELLKIAYSDE